MQDWHSPVSRLADTDGNPAPLFAGASGLLFAATLLARTAQVPHVTLRRVNAAKCAGSGKSGCRQYGSGNRV